MNTNGVTKFGYISFNPFGLLFITSLYGVI